MAIRCAPPQLQLPTSEVASSLLRRRKGANSPVLLNCAGAVLQIKKVGPRMKDVSEEYFAKETISGNMTFRIQQATRRCDGREVAIKQAYRPEDESTGEALKHEFELLQSIKHPNILQVVDLCVCGPDVAVVMEIPIGLTLLHALTHAPMQRLTERVACPLTLSLVQAVGHLHAHGICHQSIRPTTVHVSNDWTSLQLCSFEKAVRTKAEKKAVTSEMQPDALSAEIQSDEQAPYQADIRGIAGCLSYMLSGDWRAASANVDLTMDPWCLLSRGCQEVLAKTMSARSTAAMLLELQWLAKERSSMNKAASLTFTGKKPVPDVQESFMRTSSCETSSGSERSEFGSSCPSSPQLSESSFLFTR